MQRNDLIIFEFANQSGAEVLLDPNIVGELSTFLTNAVTLWANSEGNEQFSVLLAGIERGSIKIGYLLRFMETANTVFDFAARAGAALYAAGVALDVFAPTGASTPVPPVSTAYVQACSAEMDRLIRIAAHSGAEEVSISIADCGHAVIMSGASRDIGLIGSAHRFPGKDYGRAYQGPLRRIEGPFRFERVDSGDLTELYAGEVRLEDGTWLPVLIRWGSKRPISEAIALPEVVVSGRINVPESVTMQLRAVDPIDPTLRKVGAGLHVSAQQVSE